MPIDRVPDSPEEIGAHEFSAGLNEEELAKDLQFLAEAKQLIVEAYKTNRRSAEEQLIHSQQLSEKFRLKEFDAGATRISVGFDKPHGQFVVYLPQLTVGEEIDDQFIDDNMIPVGPSQTLAFRMGEHAQQLAKQSKSLVEIYKTIRRIVSNYHSSPSEQYMKLNNYRHQLGL